MSQQKAQLINATENVNLSGGLVVSGVTTAGNFIGSFSGTATGLSGTPNITLGIVTATSYSGDGSNLDNVGSPTWTAQSTTSISGTTTIDLSSGNVVYFTHNTDTTVAFANTESVQKVQFIRKKDETTTARTITWPASIIWNGGTTPTLIDSNSPDAIQVFNLTTRDQGVSWYGYESLQNDPADIATAGTLYSWGRNDYGQVGNNTRQAWPNGISSPVQIPGNVWTSTSRGRNRAFGIKSDSTLWAWGENTQGRLGQNNEIHYSSPVQIGGTAWNAISSGYHASYAIKSDKTLWGWGRADDAGELAQNDRASRSSPVQIPGTQWTVVVGGEYYASAIKDDGTLWTWGYNQQGQLGQSSLTSYSSPTQIPGTWSKIDAGRYQQIGQKTDGTLWAWGIPSGGVLAQNNNVQYSSPVQIAGTQWNDYIQNRSMAIASKTDGTFWVWGYNNYGQLGLNNEIHYSSPVQLQGNWVIPDRDSYGSTIMTILTKTDGSLWAWGRDYAGSHGDNSSDNNVSSPVQIPGTTWTTVSVNGYEALAKQSYTTPSYSVFLIGENHYGQLGHNDIAPRSSPVQLPGTEWEHIDWSRIHAVGTKTDGTLWSWGDNGYGSLGHNDRVSHSSPVQIPGTQWSTAGAIHGQASAAVKTDGTLWMWGWNNHGYLGQNDKVALSSPTQVPGTQWDSVAAGTIRIFASKTDGTLWAWGYNGSGVLGLNDRVNYSSPTQIGGTQWNMIGDFVSSSNYCGENFALTKTDGTLWAWGGGAYGGVGWGNSTEYSSPIQIPGTQWGYMAQGNGHWVATKTDGTLWTSGYGLQGQIGNNTALTQGGNSPIQLPGTQWSYGKYSLSAGRQHSTAIKTDGTMWSWGKNNHGQLNTNDRLNRSSPVQLPGTQWSKVSSGTYINAGYIQQ